ncbi:hypothetical protein [Bartonella sp. AP72JLCBS]|uniref:hypothetical protein n=1 Tax=Bartonella sp. AP72JLCBS TaxID=3243502 RepID=UPI0035D0EA78
MNSDPIAVFLLDPGFWVMIVICMIIIMLVLALYTSVFKRMKMNFQVKGALERVLKENDLATQQFWKDEAVVQKRRLQLKEKEFSADYDDDEILTIESATGLLKSLGWSVEIEGKGDYLATLFLPDREVQFLYTCNQKRALHKKLVEEKKQELREQGFEGVSDEQFVFEAEGVKHAPDITYIKDGKIAFMDIKID